MPTPVASPHASRPLLAGLLVLVSLHAFDELVLAIALPTIVAELGGQAWYGVTFASYLLAGLLGMRWGGQTVDRAGPAQALLIGYLVFMLGLLLAGTAQSMLSLIVARMLQGFGGGVGWNVAFAVVNLVWPAERRPRVIAWLDSGWILPSLLAPLLGGYLIDNWHWRGLFWVLLPITLLALVALLPKLRRLPTPALSASDGLWRVLALCAAAAAVGGILSQPLAWHWLLAIPLVAMCIRFTAQELELERGHSQLAQTRVIVLHGLVFFVFFGAETFLPWYLIAERGLSATQTGFIFSCAALSWCVASFIQSWLTTRWSLWSAVRAGLALILVSVLMTTLIVLQWLPLTVVYSAWLVAGFGMGMGFNALTTLAMHSAGAGREGRVASAMGLAQTLGIGTAALLGGVLRNQVVAQGGDLSRAILLIWLLCALVAVIALRLASKPSATPVLTPPG